MNDETRGIQTPTPDQQTAIDDARRVFGAAAVTWREVGPNSVGAIVIEVRNRPGDDEPVAADRVLPGGMTSTGAAFVANPQTPRLAELAEEIGTQTADDEIAAWGMTSGEARAEKERVDRGAADGDRNPTETSCSGHGFGDPDDDPRASAVSGAEDNAGVYSDADSGL